MKKFVFDTSALMRDYTLLERYPKEDIVLPLTVIDELDKGKKYEGDAGWNARNAIKVIYREKISIYDLGGDHELLDNDQKIIKAAEKIKENFKNYEVLLLTDDLGMAVRCDKSDLITSILLSESRLSNENYGKTTKVQVDTIAIQTIVDEGHLFADGLDFDEKMPPWSQVHLYCNSQCSVLAFWDGCKLIHVPDVSGKNSPKNMEQRFCYSALKRPEIPLVTITGQAGTGKSFLSILAALEGVLGTGKGSDKHWDKIVLVKNFQEVGKGLGFLPGTLEEKLEPWLDSVKDTMNAIYGKNASSYFSKSIENKQIEIVPMSYIRGRTFDRSFIILDEAQNTSPHEIKTVITRTGKDSKIVLLGDTKQIDVGGYGESSCGLSNVIRKFKGSPLSAHCTLEVTHRSDIAGEAARLL